MSYRIFSESLGDYEFSISLKKNLNNRILSEFCLIDNINLYKNSFGKTLIVGGSEGYLGAILISGLAALKSGSRYVEIFSTQKHSSLISFNQPEFITSYDFKNLEDRLSNYKNLLLGPGTSYDDWSKKTFSYFKEFVDNNKVNKNIVIDAGYLNLLAKQKFRNDSWILTPHVGEAAKLLDTSKEYIQKNRLDSAKKLQKIYGGIIILKGHDTIMRTSENTYICRHGNSSMGTAGMGDCLAGIILSLISLVNVKDYNNAILYAVAIHSYAADSILKKNGGIGLLASDVIVEVNNLLNQKV